MRAATHRAVQALWSGEAGPALRALSLGALPLEGAYRTAVAARNAAFDRGLREVRRARLPVISVGNLAVGGTGKTPFTAWVVGALLEAGRRPAVVARGYGEDELRLHRRWHPGVPVVADPDRARGAAAAGREGADCVVLDDGFQHRRLARDLDLVLLAAEHRFPGPLLPRGRYREPPRSLGRADVAVLTRRAAPPADADALAAAVAREAPGVDVARVRLAPAGWRALDGAPASEPRGPVLAVSSVAGPDAFRAMVADATGDAVESLAFPDHHAFSAADVEAIRRRAGGRAVAVTEKDAVKLEAWAGALDDARVLALAVDVEAGEARLRARLEEAVSA